MTDTAKIVYGADEESYAAFVGQTVGAVIEAARQFLTIPTGVSARLNSDAVVDNNIIVKAGDVISFYKESGSKGY